MKDISIIIASLILSVSIYVSFNTLANSNYALANSNPDVNFTVAKGLTMSIIEKSDALNEGSIEEVTDTYQKILQRLAEVEAEHYAE